MPAPVRTALVALATLTLMAPGIATTSADPGTSTHVDSVAAGVSGSVVSVTGSATFVDVPVTLATDPSGDSSLPAGLGTDLVSASIARPDPTKSQLTFTLGIGDPHATLFTIPEVVHYSYFFAVGEQGWLLLAARNAAANAASGGQPSGPMFRLDRFNADGTCCAIVGQVPGTMADGKVTFTTTFGQLGLTPGSIVQAHPVGTRAIQVQLGASGASRQNNAQPDFMYIDENTYTVPSATVQVGIAPAGTPEDAVPLQAAAAVTVSTGAFSGALASPGPGSYVVVAKACYGPDNCGLSSAALTI